MDIMAYFLSLLLDWLHTCFLLEDFLYLTLAGQWELRFRLKVYILGSYTKRHNRSSCTNFTHIEYLNLISEDLVEYLIGLIPKIRLNPTQELVTKMKQMKNNSSFFGCPNINAFVTICKELRLQLLLFAFIIHWTDVLHQASAAPHRVRECCQTLFCMLCVVEQF